MSFCGTLVRLVAAAGLVVGSLVATAGPAEAACTIPVSGPTKWVIDGTDTYYKYTAKSSCSRIDSWDVDANVYGPNSTYKDYDWFYAYDSRPSSKIGVDDWTKPGKYTFGSKQWYAYDSDYNDVYVSGMPTPVVYAKYASRAWIAGTRSGSKVKLSGSIKRYCGSCVDGWDEGYTKRTGTVLLQRKRYDNKSWYTFKTLYNVSGTWSHTTARANKHYFRAIVKENSTSWSDPSNKVYR
jgi:hypothetical protein